MNPHPIAFKVRPPGSPAPEGAGLRRVAVHALAGMQKEALVSGGAGGTWRLLCDEGPYLNGTDLAPFPLGFFAAGQIVSLGAAVLGTARRHGLTLRSAALRQADRYTMQGSFLRGDAVGGALTPELTVAVETSAAPAEVSAVLRAATADCPALQLLREAVTGGFTLEHNGRRVPLGGVESPTVGDPADELQSIQPAPEPIWPEPITKLSTAAAVPGVPGGAGSSLQAVQNRTLVIQGDAGWRDEPFWRTDIALAQPIGSSFRFLSPARDDAGPAPDSVDYLAAGIAFCFMTQLGRYAHIRKFTLRSYRLVQFTRLLPRPAIATHVFVESDLDDAAAADLVRTSERTCFLHAALRANLPPVIRAELNGASVSF